jgi:hypothetical protein
MALAINADTMLPQYTGSYIKTGSRHSRYGYMLVTVTNGHVQYATMLVTVVPVDHTRLARIG